MKVLIACEESQRVCIAFRKRGHEAYSCDIQEPSGGHLEWHILGDALKAIEGGRITTMDGKTHDIGRWDLLIAHPPCTYLTLAGNKWFKHEFADRFPDRQKQRKEAVEFFMAFANADCDRIDIENPAGIMTKVYGPPTQYFSPYQFGEPYAKQTGLWLKNLEPIQTDVPKKEQERLYQMSYGTYSNGKKANKFMDRKIKFDDEPEDDATGALGIKNARSNENNSK